MRWRWLAMIPPGRKLLAGLCVLLWSFVIAGVATVATLWVSEWRTMGRFAIVNHFDRELNNLDAALLALERRVAQLEPPPVERRKWTRPQLWAR